MTNEPVAYLNTYRDGSTDITRENIEFKFASPSKPLYTKEQLQPRVKMTKKQHKQFEIYKVDKNSFYHFWQSLLDDDVSLLKEISERDFMLAWLDDGAIEIVPEKKWFVRSKTEILCQLLESGKQEYTYSYLTHNSVRRISYEPLFKDELEKAINFDTKEKAEEWTNPLTEAVLLPVKGE